MVGVVTLTEPPTPPNEVATGRITFATDDIPEPATIAQSLLGLGVIIFIVTRSASKTL
jgi:hypothetical protein